MGKEYAGQLQVASKGHFYGETFPEGMLNVEPWGTKEERTLISPNINFDETVTRLITRLTDCPLPADDLLLVDRYHIFIYMRCLSYGGDYTFHFKCSECGQKVRHDMDLEKDLDVRYVDNVEMLKGLGLKSVDELQEPFTFILPDQQKELGWRMLRGKDERAVERFARRMSKKSSGDEKEDYIYRAALRIMSFDGHPVDDISEAMRVVESLKGKDALAFRQAVESVDFGIETEIEVRCKSCGYPNDMKMPLEKSFFRPERKVI
jgi:hypothetical protein